MTSSSLIFVTGMSGAGKTTVLHHLEDLGYESVDNLPLRLVHLVAQDAATSGRPMAIGLDIRTRDFSTDTLLEAAYNASPPAQLVFLDCDDVVLERRYTATRRKHPLTKELPLNDAIALERQTLSHLKAEADLIIDTTDLAPQELKQRISATATSASQHMQITVQSFSYRHGLPRDADLVFDARFLRNPHYEPDLQALTGQDAPVQAFISQDPDFSGFMDHIEMLLDPLVPRYRSEGKSYLTLAVGCTGGRHRSVFIAERIRNWLETQNYDANLVHRELDQSAGTQ